MPAILSISSTGRGPILPVSNTDHETAAAGDNDDRDVGIGFDFKRSYWGKGYATEAAMAVLEYGFTNFEFDSISGWIDPQNAPSQHVAERIGMSVERYVTRGGKKYSLYSIKRKDWNRAGE